MEGTREREKLEWYGYRPLLGVACACAYSNVYVGVAYFQGARPRSTPGFIAKTLQLHATKTVSNTC